jgi:hypothetical protein
MKRFIVFSFLILLEITALNRTAFPQPPLVTIPPAKMLKPEISLLHGYLSISRSRVFMRYKRS